MLYTGDIDLLGSRQFHGFSAEQVPVSAYVGSSKNLKDLTGIRVNGNTFWSFASCPPIAPFFPIRG